MNLQLAACQGRWSELSQLPSTPEQRVVIDFLYFTPPSQMTSLAIWESAKAGDRPKSFLERILFSKAFLAHHSEDLDFVEQYLNFNAVGDTSVEFLRLYFQGQLWQVMGNPDRSYTFFEKAFQASPHFYSPLLAAVVNSRPFDPALLLRQQGFAPILENVSDLDPYGPILKAQWANARQTTKILSPTPAAANENMTLTLSKAYERCPYQLFAIEAYATQLFSRQYYTQVIQLLETVPQRFQIYPVSFDYLLAASGVQTGHYELSQKHLKRAQEFKMYLSADQQEYLKTIRGYLELPNEFQPEEKQFLILLFAGLSLLVFSGMWSWVRWRHVRSHSFPSEKKGPSLLSPKTSH